MDYFGNESEVLQVEDLSIENRIDHISFYGHLKIGRDKKGLENARLLKEIFEDIVFVLQSEEDELPEYIESKDPVLIDNPFLAR